MLKEKLITVRLYRNDPTIEAGRVLADFSTCNFPGYSDKVVNTGLSEPSANGAIQAVTATDILTWTRGAGAGSQTVYGYVVWIPDVAGNVYFGAERFVNPITLDTAGQYVSLRLAILATSAI